MKMNILIRLTKAKQNDHQNVIKEIKVLSLASFQIILNDQIVIYMIPYRKHLEMSLI